MAEFTLPVHIGNRACQHCGVTRMDVTAGFTEDSAAASEIGFVYGKLRRAELQENTWVMAIKHAALRAIDSTTMILEASLWVESTTYFVGSIVSDDNGNFWISRQPDNLGNQPQNTPAWEAYFGPLTVSLYDDTTAYVSGELVYTADGDGTNRVYLSLESNNEDDPATAATWDTTVTYRKNQVVTRTAVDYMSLIDLNAGNDPALAPALWDSATSYGIGDDVGASDGFIYTSLTAANLNNDPTLDAGINWTNTAVLNPWTTVFVGGATSLKWLQIGGAEFPSGVTLSTPNIHYPIGTGPASHSGSRNVFKLPAGYLKTAPQDPRAGSTSALGAASGLAYADWNYESGYIVSSETGVIVLRFVADITDVRAMNDMFCEGLGARIALAVCEKLTQSTGKISTIAQTYQKFMTSARLSNFIEIGAVEPPVDDWIACRE